MSSLDLAGVWQCIVESLPSMIKCNGDLITATVIVQLSQMLNITRNMVIDAASFKSWLC
jgi:hypothetical protein